MEGTKTNILQMLTINRPISITFFVLLLFDRK